MKFMRIGRPRALGCSVPSVVRTLLRARGLLIICHWTRCLIDLERTYAHHMNLVSCNMRYAEPVHMQHMNVVPCKDVDYLHM